MLSWNIVTANFKERLLYLKLSLKSKIASQLSNLARLEISAIITRSISKFVNWVNFSNHVDDLRDMIKSFLIQLNTKWFSWIKFLKIDLFEIRWFMNTLFNKQILITSWDNSKLFFKRSNIFFENRARKFVTFNIDFIFSTLNWVEIWSRSFSNANKILNIFRSSLCLRLSVFACFLFIVSFLWRRFFLFIWLFSSSCWVFSIAKSLL